MDNEKIDIRKMLVEEASQVFKIVKTGFDHFVKQDLTEEGTKEFFRAAQKFIYDRPDNHFIFVAHSENQIIGMIDIRDDNHICLFFVNKKFQKKGVGRSLIEKAILKIVSDIPQISSLDVNSSTYAVNVYEKLGFIKTDEEQIINGIRFVPMIKTIQLSQLTTLSSQLSSIDNQIN
ncbi:MAG: GNAT family N-acetyltransferase [Fibrobacteria bacterium]|nr:GNAT family N-acetyltransferase [Fibrobacteria bacterium]